MGIRPTQQNFMCLVCPVLVLLSEEEIPVSALSFSWHCHKKIIQPCILYSTETYLLKRTLSFLIETSEKEM